MGFVFRLRRRSRNALRRFWFDRQDHRYHFIHIPKNGGSALRRALAFAGDVSMSRPYHYRYVDIAHQVAGGLRFFCTVRNPWSRTASRYMFGKQNARKWNVGDPRREYMENVSFEAFVKERRLLPIPEHPEQPWMGPLSWFDQLEWIRDDHGRVVCDCLRVEHLEDDVSAYLNRKIVVPKENVTQARYDYRAMYTTELIEVVGQYFSEDIEYFGFGFEGAAKRNVAVL